VCGAFVQRLACNMDVQDEASREWSGVEEAVKHSDRKSTNGSLRIDPPLLVTSWEPWTAV
jgi:hypothetical protein